MRRCRSAACSSNRWRPCVQPAQQIAATRIAACDRTRKIDDQAVSRRDCAATSASRSSAASSARPRATAGPTCTSSQIAQASGIMPSSSPMKATNSPLLAASAASKFAAIGRISVEQVSTIRGDANAATTSLVAWIVAVVLNDDLEVAMGLRQRGLDRERQGVGALACRDYDGEAGHEVSGVRLDCWPMNVRTAARAPSGLSSSTACPVPRTRGATSSRGFAARNAAISASSTTRRDAGGSLIAAQG